MRYKSRFQGHMPSLQRGAFYKLEITERKGWFGSSFFVVVRGRHIGHKYVSLNDLLLDWNLLGKLK